jgi:hypothetical protein
MAGTLTFAGQMALWAIERRTVGKALETTADGWSLAELEGHIREIEILWAKADGPARAFHAKHLSWLKARLQASSARNIEPTDRD